jgi:hypothetical protein
MVEAIDGVGRSKKRKYGQKRNMSVNADVGAPVYRSRGREDTLIPDPIDNVDQLLTEQICASVPFVCP